jgi:alpha-mannosidase
MSAEATARRTLDMVGIAHLDAVWLWPWQEGYAEVRATIRSALDRLDEDPDFIFTCDSVAYYAWIEENDPALFDRIRARISEGRWELAGGWWIEPDCNLPSGESLVRQGLYGQRYLADRFGRTARVGMNIDPFGHPVTLPQILRGLGLDGYVFHRPGPHEKKLESSLFRWCAPDGSEVLAYRIPHEYCAPSGDVGNHVDKVIAHVPEGTTEAMCFYGVGNHGGGPTRANLASIRRIDATAGQPHLRFSSPERFFDRVRAVGTGTLPFVGEELQHHAVGCYSAHSGIKAWNRRAEQALLAAEAWSTISSRIDPQAPDDRAVLADAWKLLGFNQFHDILAGTAIESAYVDARDQIGEVASVAARVANGALQRLARWIDIPFIAGTQPLLVFNSLPWPLRTAVEFEFGAHGEFDGEASLTDADGRPVDIQRTRSEAQFPNRRRLVFTADLPAFGYRLYRLWPVGLRARLSTIDQVPRPHARPRLRASDTVLENRHLRVVVDPSTGWLASLVDRATGASLLAPPAVPHAVVIDDPSDTWSHRLARYDRDVGCFRVDSVSLVESGPVRAIIRIDSSFGPSRLVEELVLGHDARVLEIRVTLDWFQRLQALKLRIATALTGVTATAEVPYGHVVRPTGGHEEPGQTWVDLAGRLADGTVAGLSVINDCKYGYDVTGSTLGITAVRSPVYAWHEPVVLDGATVYEFQDQGRQRFTYALMPHRGDWRAAGTVIEAARVNRRPTAILEAAHPGDLGPTASFVQARPSSIAVSVVKRCEDATDDVVVRAHETSGRETKATIELPFLGRAASVGFRAHEIKTLRLPADPLAPIVETDLLERPSVWPHAGPAP